MPVQIFLGTFFLTHVTLKRISVKFFVSRLSLACRFSLAGLSAYFISDVIVFVSNCRRLTIKSTCPMDLHKYPLDTQYCPLMIGSCKYRTYKNFLKKSISPTKDFYSDYRLSCVSRLLSPSLLSIAGYVWLGSSECVDHNMFCSFYRAMLRRARSCDSKSSV